MPESNGCPLPDDLRRFLLGQVEEEEAARVQHHLAACAACLETLARLEAEDTLVAAMRAQGRATVDADEPIVQGLMDRLNRLHRPENAQPHCTTQVGSTLDYHPHSKSDTQGQPRTEALGDYELLDELGAGGMGVVYRARQRSANRIVALKVIRPERLLDVPADSREETLQRFLTEAQAAARLEHDHIVTVYDVGEAAGQPFYSMRYVEGRSLAEILRDGPLANSRAAEFLAPVARAVHYAHERGILHRDLKPGNIMVDTGGRPYVSDFGLAKLLDDNSPGLTQTGLAVGTPAYMSPEQAQDASRATAASDIYSLGATLYDLLTGRPPFRAATPVETLRQVIESDPVAPRQLNPAIDRDLETITLKCLAKEPGRRYGSGSALDHFDAVQSRRPNEVLLRAPPHQDLWLSLGRFTSPLIAAAHSGAR